MANSEMKAYNLLRYCLSKTTVKRLTLLFDEKGAASPCPPRELLQYMDLDTISADDLVFFRGLEEVDARMRSLLDSGKDGACDTPTHADCARPTDLADSSIVSSGQSGNCMHE
jgi:hypothetical protein